MEVTNKVAWVAGVDGCKRGWVRASLCLDTRSLRVEVIEDARALLSVDPAALLVAIDVPIGLPERGSRTCDLEARRLLGQPRGSSVFPAPVRSAVRAPTYAEACSRTGSQDGRRVSRQAFAIFAKIAEVDDWLLSSSDARAHVYEAHPEVSFCGLAGRPVAESKRKRAGRDIRRGLLAPWVGEEALARAYQAVRGPGLPEDDFLDACAALWTAERIWKAVHRTLPEVPAADSVGLPMRIVY